MKKYLNLENLTGFLCILTPFILGISNWEVRNSISDYFYAEHSILYVILLALGALLYIIHGIRRLEAIKIVLGAALIGIVSTPHLEFTPYHNAFTAVFFLGHTISLTFGVSTKNLFKRLLQIGVILALVGLARCEILTVFEAEVVGIILIGLNFLRGRLED